MGKNKLRKFAENKHFPHLFQPAFDQVFQRDFHLKGTWHTAFFSNKNPLVLELGCGKGEYTVGLARHSPSSNFIGLDIKGARLWKGASDVAKMRIPNAAFIRTRIELIESFFKQDEVSEIWITFPDPQLKKRRKKKRLTSSFFLNRYRTFLQDGGLVHLKTDSEDLYRYTLHVLNYNQIPSVLATENLYAEKEVDIILSIRTHYEKIWMAQELPIKYISFQLPRDRHVLEPPDDAENSFVE